ncbi:MAG TPA: DUF1003 domain-containing protein [Candidatus Elarobacter sp.]
MQSDQTISGQIDETIESIAELERKALAAASLQQRAIERFTMAIGRPRSIAIILALVVAWVLLNAALRASGRAELDPPPYFWLDTVMGLAALLMTILILTTENRITQFEEQRSRLHLQISMLAERKAAKIIQLIEELRYDMPQVANRVDREAEALTLPANPHEVAEELEKRTPNRGELPQD